MRSSTREVEAALVEILPEALRRVLGDVTALATPARPIWIVGGVVRDAFLGVPCIDLDLMVEPLPGDGDDPLIDALAERTGAEVEHHPTFMTAVLTLPSGARVDVAHSRTEHYPAPAALPVVSPAGVEDDLRRRDYTINAIALRVEGGGPWSLEDPHGGYDDLRGGVLRVLHRQSFVDDPTRIFRGVRLGARLGYAFEIETEALAREALAQRLPDALSSARLMAELRHMAEEASFAASLAMLTALGGMSSLRLHPPAAWAIQALSRLAGPPEARLWLLLMSIPPEARGPALERWGVVGGRGQRIVTGLGAADAVMEAMERGDTSPSTLVPLLEKMGPEVRLAAQARAAALGRDDALALAMPMVGAAPPLNGRDLMALGVERGPEVGLLLGQLRQAWLAGQITDRDGALAWARARISAATGATQRE